MANVEPRDARKLAIGVALIAAATIVSVMVFGGRAHSPKGAAAPVVRPQAAAPAQAAPAAPLPAQPTVPTGPVLDRAALLAGAALAASAYGEGAPMPAAVAGMAGRRFSLAIAFGCEGPAAEDAAMGWTVGPGGDTLRVSVRREDWTASPFASALGGPGVEAVEGFWLPRPWVQRDRCPRRPADPLASAEPAPSRQTVGVANVYGRGSSRVSRRGDRPYEVIRSLEDAERPDERGLLLLVEGRVVPFDGGAPVRCRAASPEQQPVCLIGAEIERVAIRNPATNTPLGEWRQAAPLTPVAPAPAERSGPER